MLLDGSRFDELAESTSWQTIDEIVAVLDGGEFWTDDWLDGAIVEAKKQKARDFLNSRKDADGMPLWPSVVIKDESGRDVRIFKQERLFNADDYVSQITFHQRRLEHHAHLAKRYRDRGIDRFGEQLRFKLNEGAA